MRLYRQLAQARPDAFLPNLAMSLNNLANRLSALGRREEAIEARAEAIRLLTAPFAQLPAGFGLLMAGIVRDYLESAEAAKQPPDEKLLAPVMAVFDRLKKSENKE